LTGRPWSTHEAAYIWLSVNPIKAASMSNCANQELSKGYSVPNPKLVIQPVTTDDVPYSVMTVFNETDQTIKVSYKNNAATGADFLVPKAGRSFTRVINQGLMAGTLKVQSLGADATGNVIINLGN
jgi:hypothetical protein